ncbi:MAG TPA: two-component sensor histidine kinase, partial [Massilia sp.]|nr:two-component sensor histidine kinase [Massilia sp.]
MKAFLGSMTGRVFITLLLGVLITGALTQWLADNERQRVLEHARDQNLIERAEQLIMATEIVPTAARPAYLEVANRPGLSLEVGAPRPLAKSTSDFAETLAERLGAGYHIVSADSRPRACDSPPRIPQLYGLLSARWRGACEFLNVRLRDGEELRLAVLPPRAAAVNDDTDYRAVIVLFFLSIAGLAYLVARMTTRPLKRLAVAAQELGNDINRPPLDVSGASEIRQASTAFNAMQARIRQYIFQRTQMLAAITHDLQTPLTRMRLRLEKVADA